MRPTFRLVPDFIIPHLNKSTYGDHLLWEDKKYGSFKISRVHQSSELWNEKCIEVYKAWSMKKNHWNARDPKRITKAKHRLITALRRSPEIEMLMKEPAFYRFRIVHPEISDMTLDQENSTYYSATPPIKNKQETSRHLEPTENSENIHEENKELNDQSIFTTYDPNANLSLWPYSQYETQDAQKEISITDNNFPDDICLSEPKSTSVSDKCCCINFLDFYLSNQKCIWHGVPP